MEFISLTIARLKEYKSLAEKAMGQLNDEELLRAPNDESANCVVILVKHLHGNMLSRWTHFLTEDGEKSWRQRDNEFLFEPLSRTRLMELWEEGWACYLGAMESLEEADLLKTVFIRTQPHSVTDAIQRQLMHYSYHLGQLVLFCKQEKLSSWKSLSIPKGGTASFNADMVNKHTNQGGK
ncbi:MAG: DUF1572 family protein [Bacteroidetes bacterium]|nr:DUF1572 family protein [Bacteroidota bacterium]